MTVKLLICDDDPDIGEVVSFAAGIIWPTCQVKKATNGNDALRLFHETSPDLIVLDVGMPPPNGFEVCKRIREVSQVPIIMLTAHHATADKIKAFEIGVDDFVTKPFDSLELLARMRALVRRVSGVHDQAFMQPAQEIVIGDLLMNTATREVRVKGEPIHLTSTEYKLLEEMARHVGTVLSHDTLLRRVWGPEYEGEERYLKVFVRRLRQKLGDNTKKPRYIQTEWGVGYRVVPQS
ncbi:MAG: response regulator transcription factor [Chloroflexia bacterium]